MSTRTIQLRESLKKRIEALAAREGYTVSQSLASACTFERTADDSAINPRPGEVPA